MTDSLSKGERLRHQRIDFAAVADFVREHHRHHTPPIGHIFSLAAFLGDRMVGVAIVGRPVARHRDDGLTAEITRLCVIEGVRNAASFLLGACARAALALGFRRIGTYIAAANPAAILALLDDLDEATSIIRAFCRSGGSASFGKVTTGVWSLDKLAEAEKRAMAFLSKGEGE